MALSIYFFFNRQGNYPVSKEKTDRTRILWQKYLKPLASGLRHLHNHLQKHSKRLKNRYFQRINYFIVESILWKRLISTMQKSFSKSRISLLFRKDNVAKYLSLFTLITILLVLPASKSRASWLAVLASSCFLIILLYPIKKRIQIILDAIWKKMVAAFLVCLLLIASGLAIYSFKKDSADGRLLIWKVSTEMINDQPIVGHGFNKFQAHYMDYQADYFQDFPNSEEVYYADNISYPFNEYVKILAEQGIIGFMLLISILIIILLLNKHKFNVYILIAKAGILSLAVFAFFSYPSEILPIKVLAIILLAISSLQQSAANKEICKINLTGFGIKFSKALEVIFPVITLALLVIIYSPIKNLYNAYNSWDEAYLLYKYEDYKSSIDSYKCASTELSSEGEFLIMYGKALSMAAEYKKAIEILHYAEQYQTNTILYTALGDCYSILSDYENAESAYLKAHFMVPNRFYPKYLLAKMYQESGHIEKAKSTAQELLSKPVKIESTAIKEIREEMKLIIDGK
ncbi:MAG: O-antigen ligase family protein [Candidatus Paceibacterota bacterium]